MTTGHRVAAPASLYRQGSCPTVPWSWRCIRSWDSQYGIRHFRGGSGNLLHL